MAKPWADVAASPEYQALPDDQKESARGQYFDSVVAPQVPKEKLESVRQQFNSQTGLKHTADASDPYADTAKRPGLMEGAKRGLEQTGIGMMQLGNALSKPLGIKQFPEFQGELAKRAGQLEEQGKGTGVAGAVGEIAANPTSYIPLGGITKAGASLGAAALKKLGPEVASKIAPSLAKILGAGATAGAIVGGASAAISPSANSNQTLGDRGINTAIGAGLGGAVGAAAGALGAGAQKLIGAGAKAAGVPKLAEKLAPKLDTGFSKAASFFGMDFKNAKTDEQIAQEVNRAVVQAGDNMGSMISDRSEGPQQKTSTMGNIGRGIINTFAKRKTEESGAWNAAEPAGNELKHDMNEAVEKLTAHLKELEEATSSGTGTEKAKSDLALVRAALAKIGAPVQDAQSVIEKTKDVGGYSKVIEGSQQFPQNAAQSATKTIEPTTEVGGKRFVERSQTPINTDVAVDGKTKTISQSPYSVTTRTTKGEAPKPPRQGTAGDLVRAMRDVVNSDKYADASKDTKNAVRGILNDELATISKNNPNFSKLHSKAIQATQRNADIYRDEGKMAEYGLSEKRLWNIQNKMANDKRMVGLSDVQDLNNQSKNIKTREDLLEYRRLLPRPLYNTLMRTRFSTLWSDINMDVSKFKELRPLISEMLKQSQIPKAKIDQFLDNYEAVAQKMTDAGLPGDVRVPDEANKLSTQVRAIMKTLGIGLMYSNSAHRIVGGALVDAIPKPSTVMAQLRNLKSAAKPTSLFSEPLASGGGTVSGAAVGNAISGQNQ